ncbi:MAG: radical SAM protein [Dehalococcoidia bacterium]|nr:radical SAM protein [Dehalococcoidia bacterium]
MISVSKLLCGAAAPNDHLRYGKSGQTPESFSLQRPIVVWNCTRSCNLHCVHCYATASNQKYEGELTTDEGKAFLRDLADFKAPVILFSGGEPVMRGDLFDLASYAKGLGIKVALSTNGTLITEDVARRLRDVGFGEVGISLDGIGGNNDRFRGSKGAFDAALQGIRNSVSLGLRVSLRLTITGYNYKDIPAIFDLVEREKIDRVCIYHLAYVGRAGDKRVDDITPAQTRSVVDFIFEKTAELHGRGLKKEILTVDNHVDGVYLYLKVKREQPERAAEVLELLQRNGGNSSGIRIGAVDNLGNVHADQFWWHYSFGNVRQRKFGDIWMDTSDPLMRGLKNRRPLLKGRCSLCQYLDLCGGNLRVRAEATYGDVWAPDPACYLTDEEIGLDRSPLPAGTTPAAGGRP